MEADQSLDVIECRLDEADGGCPLYVSHFTENVHAPAIWHECLHPNGPTLKPLAELKAVGFAVPQDCPLRRRALRLVVP